MTKQKLMVFTGSFLIILAVTIYFNSVNNDITTTLNDTSINTDGSSHIITCSLAETLDKNQNYHEDDEDYNWDSFDVISITFNTNSISVDNENGILINETIVTITSAGTYSISGTLDNGRIIVDTDDVDVVRLIFNGVNISSTTKAPIHIANAEKTVIILSTGTKNYITDNKDNEEKGALFSNDDLTIYGDGSLTVSGNANDAIRSDDGLIIKNGNITVTSVDDGIRGKDYLVIKGGSITVYSIGDGLKSDNDEDEDRGYIYINDSTININSTQGDAITAQTDLLITGGTFTLVSGSGGYKTLDEDLSTKGLKAAVSIVIDDGDFTISSSDDSIHSNDGVVINNGTFNISSWDDGIHADSSLGINGGAFNISKSYEGLESDIIIIKNGNIQINSSDDGINANGNDTEDPTTGYVSIENSVLNITSGGDAIQADTNIMIISGEIIVTSGGGSDSNILFSAKGIKADVNVIIDGGTFIVNSADDALHSNGNIAINGGSFVISTGDDAIHADSSVEVNGGDISITKSFEGIESGVVVINGGDIHIVSSDDGINVVGVDQRPNWEGDPPQMDQRPNWGGDPHQMNGTNWEGDPPQMDQRPNWGGDPHQDMYSDNSSLHIYGGYVYIDALGDGIDVNGAVEMTAGYLVINGPIANNNGALDFGTFNISGGFLLAVGSSGMAQAPSASSTQESVLLRFESSIQDGTLVNIQTRDGKELFSFIATKRYQSMAFSSPDLLKGVTYNFYVGGSSTGIVNNGLYVDGTYSPGTLLDSFTV